MTIGYYDRQGNRRLDTVAWGRLMEDPEYKRVALDQFGGFQVSTVWLGLDHSFGKSKPLIFETMIFGPDGDDVYCERYSTEAEALAGHLEVLHNLREGTLEGYEGNAIDSTYEITEEPTLI